MEHRYGNCVLGVDYSKAPHELPPGALGDAQNIIPNEAGLVQGRNGSSALNSTSLESRLTSLHEFRTGTTRNTLASYGTNITKFNTTTNEFNDKITGLTSGKMLQWVNFYGKAIAVNEGSDAPQYWSSDSAKGDLAGSPPKGTSIAEWSHRVWLGGDSTNVGH